ncbi:MAG: hypothetical protein EFT35_09985 [Methanophagales archaeon ANME-1-THS]|nr:MAG: hypothetical protein EFT35_09985 [Methanophagales archaeon ANME-1-THS]
MTIKKGAEGMRKKKLAGVVIVALFFSIVGICSTASMSEDSPGSQRWYLDSEDHPVAGKLMEKTGTQSGSVTIAGGEEEVWLADSAALIDVTFPGGFWVVGVRTDRNWGDKCRVSLGGFNPTSGWYEIPTKDRSWSWNIYVLDIALQADPATIKQGDYLALKITNEDEAAHTVHAGRYSLLRSPRSDPGYPIPELPALVLMSVGLLALVSYVVLRRKG